MIRPATSRQAAHDTGRRAVMFALMTSCLLIVTGAASATAESQRGVQTDSPWLPWLGCWQLVEETGALADQANDAGPFADRVVVCLTPTGTTSADAGGVSVTTIADGTPVLVETLLADGAQHPVEEAACRGWRRNTWSRRRRSAVHSRRAHLRWRGCPPRIRGGAHDELHDLAGHSAGKFRDARGGHGPSLSSGRRVDHR